MMKSARCRATTLSRGFVRLFLYGLALAVSVLGCGSTDAQHVHLGETLRVLLFGERVAGEASEKWEPVGPMLRLHRTSVSASAPDVVTRVEAWLQRDGTVFRATWSRQHKGQTRSVSGEVAGAFVRIQESAGAIRYSPISTAWVLPETLHVWQSESGASVTLVDLSTGESLVLQSRLERNALLFVDDNGSEFARREAGGVRVGPGSFTEFTIHEGPAPIGHPARPFVDFPRRSLTGAWWLKGVDPSWSNLSLFGPAQRFSVHKGRVKTHHDPSLRDRRMPAPRDYLPALGIESDQVAIQRFSANALTSTSNEMDALRDAWRLAQFIHKRMKFSERGGPPSALATLETFVGDCDNATALLVAALRARGHAARAVVGYRVWNGLLSPHAWAEVYTGEEWQSVDPTIPAKGPLLTHLRMFEGLGSALSMGRVLGRLEVVALAND